MKSFRIAPEAEDDILEIWAYIARDNIPAANSVHEAIYGALALPGTESPARSDPKDLTNRPLRFWTLPRYYDYIAG